MFKRKKYVPVSSEKAVAKIENFLDNEGSSKTLTPDELYSFRYDFNDAVINIKDDLCIQRIKMNDFIRFVQNSTYHIPFEDYNVTTAVKNINKRIIFLTKSSTTNILKRIWVYIPDSRDCSLMLSSHSKIDISDFINGIKDISEYYVQNAAICNAADLDFEHEFFIFTNIKIEDSTFTIHYVP